MEINAAPRAPESAATLPPPGAGDDEASSSRKAFRVLRLDIVTSFIK
jgi:hypothetical protein